MATRTIVNLIDDLNGRAADETITFALDGIEYTIDLTTKNAAALRKVFAPYVKHAAEQIPLEATRAGRDTIRAWANTHGWTVAGLARIPTDAVAAYHRAHRSRPR